MLQRFQAWIKERMAPHLLGIDIGSNSIKVLEIDTTTSPYVILNSVVLPLSERTMSKERIKNPATIGSILKETLKWNNIKTQDVAMAISHSSIVMKDIQISKRLKPSDIESRVWLEADRHFPELVGDIYLDFVMTGTATQDPTQSNVMLVACRKDQVKPYLEILLQAGLVPKIVTVSSFALERALANMTSAQQRETVGLINFDLAASNFIVMHNNTLYYALDQSYDGQKLLTQVNAYLQQKTNHPETQTIYGTLFDEAYLSILKTNLISHLRHAMHFFISSRPNTMIQQLFLSGDCSIVPFLSQFVQQEFGIETILATPFNGMVIADHLDQVETINQASTFMLCCGLALSRYSS